LRNIADARALSASGRSVGTNVLDVGQAEGGFAMYSRGVSYAQSPFRLDGAGAPALRSSAHDDYGRADLGALIEIDDIVVGHTDAAG
jgi:hypothetical protein